MTIFEYLKEAGYEELSEERIHYATTLENIINGIDVKENIEELLKSEDTYFVEELLKYNVEALCNLEVSEFELLCDFIYDNFLFDSTDVFKDFIFDQSFYLSWEGLNEDNIDKAKRYFEIGILLNALMYNLAWSLAWYYEDSDFELSMKYFDYALKNSCLYIVMEYYGAKVIRFASRYRNNKEYEKCIEILKTALNSFGKCDKNGDYYQEYLELSVYLISTYIESKLATDDEIALMIDSEIKVAKNAVELLRGSRGGMYYHVSDTDTERSLLNLYIFKLRHLLKVKKYEDFMNCYNFALEEIALSGSTRYYAPIHELFDEMIKAISIEREEFAFVKDLTSDVKVYFKDEVLSSKEVQNIKKEFMLCRKDNNSSLEFYPNEVVVDGNDCYLVANPNYPSLGEGKRIVFMVFFEEETYLKVIDWKEYLSKTAHLYFKNVVEV